MIIDRFDGEYRFLSNFWCYTGPDQKLSVEHFYQAAKATSDDQAQYVLAAYTPGQAKRRGQEVTLRPDWDLIKLDLMRVLVHAKFLSTPELAVRLCATDGATLIEGNHWHDQFWGDCRCDRHAGVPGQNHLGRILMDVRATLGRR